jgi:ferredoxin
VHVRFVWAVWRFVRRYYIEIIDLPEYPEKEVDEAIMFCPEDCIAWSAD